MTRFEVNMSESDDEFMFDAESDEDFDAENVAPVSKKIAKTKTSSSLKSAHVAKNATKAGKKLTGILEERSINEIASVNKTEPSKTGGKAKTVEEMYQKKTQLEHILLRPDTYSKFNYVSAMEDSFSMKSKPTHKNFRHLHLLQNSWLCRAHHAAHVRLGF